ncbi:fatty acid synthase-like [Xylocopa sonorina]|uniref:fatty acid synthase-like n=1 Tax=Xylocopa sonorina TaxID=1818115 RepID=UPI00403AB179
MSGNMRVDSTRVNYAKTEPGEEVVITGISGKYPESKNVLELKDNLMNKVDVITDNSSRWKLEQSEVPKAGGKVGDLDKFDAAFFDIHYKQAHVMDPMFRKLLECVYETILDAGLNPMHLKGTNTGVVTGCSIVESESIWIYEKLQADGYGITGCNKSMISNWISHFLDLKGPSYGVDTACSTSMFALDQAYRMIRMGMCENVIVTACNLCLHPSISVQFNRLGVLSPDCRSKSFDASANGYARSEVISAILLQKAKNAKRIYAQVVYTKTNCDGYKEQGITFPAAKIQEILMSDLYKECHVSPYNVAYLEAHATGTAVGDPEELNSINNVFCKDRGTPLKIGSIRSNIGHPEAASGLSSVAKIIIAMEGGVIPPNINFKSPLRGVKCMDEGKVQVITEPTPWEGGYAALNSFGFGGANAHALLKSHTKEKVNNGAPEDDLPRLVTVSGRTQEAIETLLNHVESIPIDVEYIRLLHNIYTEHVPGYLYRGYTVLGSKVSEKPPREIRACPEAKRPVWFVFGGMGSQWVDIGEALMRLPIFAKSIQKCDTALKPYGLNVSNIITNKDKQTYDNNLNTYVAIIGIQIGLVDLLTSMGIEPDNIIGHSAGEIGCAYADRCFTAEQTILTAYFRGLAFMETKTVLGSMAAVGLGYEKMKDLCPSDICISCHNGPDSCTICGPVESMKKFVSQLQAKKIFVKEVLHINTPYHSHYIAEAGPKYLKYLKRVIPEPKLRSSKWLSTAIPQDQWHTQAAKYCSAEYHTSNLLNTVYFAQVVAMIPSNAVTIELTPNGLLQSILKRSLDRNTMNVTLSQAGHKDNLQYFLEAIGKLYNVGLQPQLANIYPHVEFPVSRGTPMISPYIRWDHSKSWYVTTSNKCQKILGSQKIVAVNPIDDDYTYMVHHVIDGRNLIPATGYLVMVWEIVSQLNGKRLGELSVVFEDVKFKRATTVPEKDDVALTITVHKGTGKFEISEKSTSVVTGTVRHTTNPSEERIPANYLKQIEDEEVLTEKDIYKELKLRGYEYTGMFRALKSASIMATSGRIAWLKNWAAFMDNMLQIKILGLDTRTLFVPTSIQKLVIDTTLHNNIIRNLDNENNEVPFFAYKDYDTVIAGGIEIRGLKANSIQRRDPMSAPVLEEYKFVANRDKAQVSLTEMIILSSHLALENHLTTTPKVVELVHREDKVSTEETLAPIFAQVLSDLPIIRPTIILATEVKPDEKLSLPNEIQITEPNKLSKDGSVFIVAAHNILSNKRVDVLKQILFATVDHGFILLQESVIDKDTFSYIESYGLNVVLEKSFNNHSLLLLKKKVQPPQRTEIVYANNNEFSWIEKVKSIMKDRKGKEAKETVRLVLVAEGDMENGVLGLVKCLRRELYGDIVKTVIIQDGNAPKFSLDNPFYSKQLDIDICYNVLRPNKVWGTYRHVPYQKLNPILVQHGYVDVMIKGNLSSLQWVQGAIQLDSVPEDSCLVRVVYSSLNFKDVMLATAKISPTKITRNTDCLIGFEFSGIDVNGRRLMGFADGKCISNLVVTNKHKVWPVPDEWSLEDAATVPTAYFTVLYAFFYFGKLRKGEKVLIHAGSGAVGQAAIYLALAEDCEVFTTVGTDEKRKFIRETFPSIDDDHIGNSRDTTFEQMIMKMTHGKGVDIVLNSLAEDKLQASIRCLGRRGRFLEIGKFDMMVNNEIKMEIFLKEVSFHGVLLDTLLSDDTADFKELYELMSIRLKRGVIKPLRRQCFEKNQVEEAFRFMAAGKHIGKILIKITDQEAPMNTPVLAYPRFYPIENKSYVLIGGLGGLGLEFADWLVLRGAKNLVMVSRNGVKTGYQKLKTELWKSYGVKILVISNVDASKADDCEFILRSAEKQAPVDGIFNLAAILKDCLMENQTEKSFEESMKPKANITKQLDKLSRKICPNLRHFVVFSSLSCGRGTPGQTNYGMGNAVMERICERRAEEGLPGMAIQWGVVGDVGLAADLMENNQQLAIGGTLPQSISSCLEELDKFLVQSRPIIASMVVAEKRRGTNSANNILEAVMNIMNIKDLKAVTQSSSLAELGMDSMLAVEIIQTLERDFEVSITPKDIRSMTIAKLIEMSAKEIKKETEQVETTKAKIENLTGIQLFMKTINLVAINNEYCVELPTQCSENKDEVFFIPGIEGTSDAFMPLASKLKLRATCLQLGVNNSNAMQSIEDMAACLLPHVLTRIKNRKDFVIVGYSFGSLIAIELVRKLESCALKGQLIIIDGSPNYLKVAKSELYKTSTEDEFQNMLLTGIMKLINIECDINLRQCTNWNEKLDTFIKNVPDKMLIFSPENMKTIISLIYKRLNLCDTYNPSPLLPLKTPITLLKPTLPVIRLSDPAYGLRELTEGKVIVHTINGDHISILEHKNVAAIINGEPLSD